MNNTKIIATIGPASEDVKMLSEMTKAGMDVCRLNFSHGDYNWHRNAIKKIRQVEKKIGVKIGIMADIQGPRIRVANKNSFLVKKNEKIFVTDRKSLNSHRYKKELILDWEEFYLHIKKGDRIFIEDGIFDLEVIKKEKQGCIAQVLIGGKISPHKGVNIPAVSEYLGFLTEKDLADLEFLSGQDINFIAVSFIRSGADIIQLQKILENFLEKNKRAGKMPWIISKVERKKAIRNIESIIEESDAIMVARGDLAIETSQEKMAVLQKDIIKKCLAGRKPVIVATQMMASMIENERPTRAEISDVANAVVDQADAIMFSNETAVGKNPLAVIQTADKIIRETEKSSYNDMKLKLINRFARMLFRAEKSKRTRRVKAKNMSELLEYSSLRQEKIKLSLDSSDSSERRKAGLVWGRRG